MTACFLEAALAPPPGIGIGIGIGGGGGDGDGEDEGAVGGGGFFAQRDADECDQVACEVFD